jgi:hypothetical protein
MAHDPSAIADAAVENIANERGEADSKKLVGLGTSRNTRCNPTGCFQRLRKTREGTVEATWRKIGSCSVRSAQRNTATTWLIPGTLLFQCKAEML